MRALIKSLLCLSACLVAVGACSQSEEPTACEGGACAGPEDAVDSKGEAVTAGGLPPGFQCVPYIVKPGAESCQFYGCRDEIQSCGPTGYWLGFGLPLCLVFSNVIRPQMSSFGKVWIDVTRTCLQVEANKVPTTAACGDVFEQASDSHPGCWLGSGYCFLKPADKQILASLPVGPGLEESYALFLQGLDEACAGR